MPRLLDVTRKGLSVPLQPSFPAITCPVQSNLTTGVGPETHGVVANGFYWRDKGQVEMWTAWNEVVQAPQIWETLKNRDASLTSAVWFPPLSKGARADLICTPAPVHNHDGSDSLWCYTKPAELYGALRDSLGHFPLTNDSGPNARLKSTAWIVDSFIQSAYSLHPRFSYVYLPHLDDAAQKFGPDSSEAQNAVAELDMAIGALIDGFKAARIKDVVWLVASEYCITPVSSVGYPNRLLREAGFLTPVSREGREDLVPRETPVFAMVDHQIAHVFVRDAADVARVARLFKADPTVSQVLAGDERSKVGLNHPRSGEVILIAKPDAWFAYYWWEADAQAPPFATTLDLHRKPGVDPVELFAGADGKTPLDATLVKGSHGSLESEASRDGVLVSSDAADWFAGKDGGIRDVDVSKLVFSLFGVSKDSI
jgi:predicted AlkP superfamily pyrophosphatase or phosphodiesterase